MDEVDAGSSVVDSILESGIGRVADDGSIRVTEEFRRTVERERARLENESKADEDLTAFYDAVEAPPDLHEDYPNVVAVARAVHRLNGTTDPKAVWDQAIILNQFRDASPEADGVPEGFLPVFADQFGAISAVYRYVLAYVWRADCKPCDVVAGHLSKLDADRLDEVTCVAMFGPSAPELLAREYDVGGGPTLLFLEDGSVKTRLLGAATRTQIENCLEILLE